MPKVYIIIVNWNGWRDTIECLESVLRLDYPSFRVIVCDNASSDSSLDRIAEWAGGGVASGCSNPDLQHLTSPPCSKPIPFLRTGPGERVALEARDEKLFLVQTGSNLGFAGGSNVGLRLALNAGDFHYAWLLNNDTVVAPQALTSLVRRMQERPDAGICGSALLYYHDPSLIQAAGGSVFNRWLARGGHIGMLGDAGSLPPPGEVELKMKYVVGASMLVSRVFLETIGLMSERYFLYFEEIDWATRARGRYSLAFAPQSTVYHKEGRSIGSSADRAKRTPLSEYYGARSRMLFTAQHFPLGLLGVAIALLGGSLLRFSTGNPSGAGAVLRGLRDAFSRRKAGNSAGRCAW